MTPRILEEKGRGVVKAGVTRQGREGMGDGVKGGREGMWGRIGGDRREGGQGVGEEKSRL